MIDRKAIASKIIDAGYIAPKIEKRDEIVYFLANLFDLSYEKTLILLDKCIDKTVTIAEAKLLFCNKIYSPDGEFGLEETEVIADSIQQLDFFYLKYDFACVYETDDGLIKLCDPMCEHYVVLNEVLTDMWNVITNIQEELGNA